MHHTEAKTAYFMLNIKLPINVKGGRMLDFKNGKSFVYPHKINHAIENNW